MYIVQITHLNHFGHPPQTVPVFLTSIFADALRVARLIETEHGHGGFRDANMGVAIFRLSAEVVLTAEEALDGGRTGKHLVFSRHPSHGLNQLGPREWSELWYDEALRAIYMVPEGDVACS